MYLTCQTVEERCGLAECPQTALLSGEGDYQLNTQVNLRKCVHITVGCVQEMLPAGTVNMYGPPSRSAELSNTIHQDNLYIFPSINFSCNGTITDIRMRMLSTGGQSIRQEEVVFFLLFHDRLNSTTRRVSYILLNQTNTQQEFPNQIWNNSDPLSLPVTEGTYIGFAIPTQLSPYIWSKTINFSPTSETVEARLLHIALRANHNYSGFEGRVLEAARTAHSNQFTPWIVPPPLIDIIVSKCMFFE